MSTSESAIAVLGEVIGPAVERARNMGYTMIAAGTDSGLLQQAYAGLVERIDGGSR